MVVFPEFDLGLMIFHGCMLREGGRELYYCENDDNYERPLKELHVHLYIRISHQLYHFVFTGTSRPFYHGRRRLSIEFEDLDIQTSTGKVFAPARSKSMRQLSLFLSDSMISMASNAPHERDEDFWIGTPEAIQSIRRPRKSIAQQRLGKLLARSNTYLKDKDVSDHVATGKNVTLSGSSTLMTSQGHLNRSQSLKERPRSHRSSTQDTWSRTNSWKGRGRKNLNKSVECVNEELQFLELSKKASKSPAPPRGRRGGSRNAILSRQSSNLSLRDFVSGPETKSSVWGVVEAVHDDSIDGAMHRQQKQRVKNRFPSGDSLQFPPIATEGSTSSGGALSSPRCTGAMSTSPMASRKGTNSREGSFKKKY